MRGEIRTDLLCDRPAQIILHIEQVFELAVVVLSPEVGLVTYTNQLRADASLSTLAADASFEDVVDAQLPADLADGFVGVLVGHGRSPGDDAKIFRAELAQVCNSLLGQPVAEILLLRIIAQILER